MNLKSLNFKFLIGALYLFAILVGLFFLFSFVDLSDLTSYNFIKENKNLILDYKDKNFTLLAVYFFVFCIIWVLCFGFAMPLLIFSGFVFGKWWGILIVVVSTTIGATLLYLLAGLFFRDFIKEKFSKKYLELKEFFNKNELIYFMTFRFVGGGGTPYSIQNILPVLFNMSVKNYTIATFIGSIPSMFVTVSLGSGIERVIDQNEELSYTKVLFSPDIYLPIVGFFIILLIAFVIKKIYFKDQNNV